MVATFARETSESENTVTLPDFLERDRYGAILIAGHRITLGHILTLYRDGYSVEMLSEHFPTLSVADIHKVLAFYLENVEEVDAMLLEARVEIDRQMKAGTGGPTADELRERMQARSSATETH